MNDTPTPMTGAETKEAWAAVSRTPDGMYDSRIPISAYAYAMNDHSRKMERERNQAQKQRDTLAQALRECREDSVELLGERDWWKNEPRLDYQKRYQETRDNVTRADEALATLTQPKP
jgi:hypothetical protein